MEVMPKLRSASSGHKAHLIILLCVQAVIVVLIVAGLFLQVQHIHLQRDREIQMLFGFLQQTQPELVPGAAQTLMQSSDAGEAQSNYLETGKEVLIPYGYPIDMPRQPLYVVPLWWLVACAVVLLSNLFIFHRSRRKNLEKAALIAWSIRSNLEGRPHRLPDRNENGVWEELFYRYNQLIRQLQESAEELKKEKQFLQQTVSDISHQLKTPLSSLVMYNDLLTGNENLPEDRRKAFLDACSGQLRRMDWLIKALLKMARLETQTIEYNFRPLEPEKILRRALDELDHLRGDRRVEVYSDLEPSGTLSGDEGWLIEAFGNCIKNAYQHTENNGCIRIGIETSPLFVRIYIDDDGPGIPEAELPRVFERFYMGSSSVDMESVGIGLYLSKMISEDHGGKLSASNNPKGGARFIFTFPY